MSPQNVRAESGMQRTVGVSFSGDQFIALLYGQLAGAQRLRDIEAGLVPA